VVETSRIQELEIERLPVLLLDLDGVVILEARGSCPEQREILLLHRDLGAQLKAARRPTLILTHRSRREAEYILGSAGLTTAHYVRLIAAEDLFKQACATLQFRQLIRAGLEKALALPVVEKITGRSRDDVVIVDDRQHNLDSLVAAGAGLALKAPSNLSGDGRTVTTFDVTAALRSLDQWHAERSIARQRNLAPVTHPIAPWQRSGLSTVDLDQHAFNRARRIFFAARNSLQRARARN